MPASVSAPPLLLPHPPAPPIAALLPLCPPQTSAVSAIPAPSRAGILTRSRGAQILSPRSPFFSILLPRESPIPVRGGSLLQPCINPFLDNTQCPDGTVAGLHGRRPGLEGTDKPGVRFRRGQTGVNSPCNSNSQYRRRF